MRTENMAGMRFMLAAFMVAASLALLACQSDSGKSFHLTGKETRPVLDPAQFTGQTRAAYAAAQKYPEIMNEVFCYCYCDQPPFHHSTLLSCFTENHGAG